MKSPKITIFDFLPMLTVTLHKEGNTTAFMIVAAIFFSGRSVAALLSAVAIVKWYALEWSERCIISGWIAPAVVLVMIVALAERISA
jgi:hypothetical protein